MMNGSPDPTSDRWALVASEDAWENKWRELDRNTGDPINYLMVLEDSNREVTLGIGAVMFGNLLGPQQPVAGVKEFSAAGGIYVKVADSKGSCRVRLFRERSGGSS